MIYITFALDRKVVEAILVILVFFTSFVTYKPIVLVYLPRLFVVTYLLFALQRGVLFAALRRRLRKWPPTKNAPNLRKSLLNNFSFF